MYARKTRTLIYFISFFVGLNMAFAAYISSSFLAEIVGTKNVGLVYIVSALITISGLTYGPKLITSFGYKKVIVTASLLGIFSAVLLATPTWPILTLVSFIIYYFLGILLRFFTDLYLENFSDDEHTGEIRGLYLSSHNLAWLLSPLAGGLLVSALGSFYGNYLVSGVALIPVFIIGIFLLKEIDTKTIPQASLWQTFYKVWCNDNTCNPNLYRIITIDLLLNIFYGIMVIYTPIYLHETIGLGWDKIGLIFTIMLLPFVLLQWPLGKIADKYLGEKEMMVAGLVIISFFTLIIPFIKDSNVFVWMAILFMTRVGASTTETMKEVYLFKVIGPKDIDLLGLFRKVPSVAYVISPIVGTGILHFFGFASLFIGLSFVMFCGVYYALALVDTR